MKESPRRLPGNTDHNSPGTIGFRLDDESRSVLFDRAAQLRVSPHELARYYVTELLAAPEERRALREAVTALHEELSQMRKDFVFALSVVLTSAGKLDQATVDSWIEKNFRSRSRVLR